MTADDLLSKRFAALAAGDFFTLYDTYHKDSPFIQQFSERSAYVRFARQQLGAVKVLNWQSLQQRQVDRSQQEHLLMMELDVDGTNGYFYELALLINTPDGWRYHSAQKLTSEDYPGPPEQIQFAHFNRIPEKIRY